MSGLKKAKHLPIKCLAFKNVVPPGEPMFCESPIYTRVCELSILSGYQIGYLKSNSICCCLKERLNIKDTN